MVEAIRELYPKDCNLALMASWKVSNIEALEDHVKNVELLGKVTAKVSKVIKMPDTSL